VATGRSDCPNQVNNVLGFPFIFRGALDVRASCINEEDEVCGLQIPLRTSPGKMCPITYYAPTGGQPEVRAGLHHPQALDSRVMLWESTAVAKAAMETGVARKKIDIDEYREQLAFRQGKGARVRYFIMHKAQSAKPKKRIALGREETKIIRAACPGAG